MPTAKIGDDKREFDDLSIPPPHCKYRDREPTFAFAISGTYTLRTLPPVASAEWQSLDLHRPAASNGSITNFALSRDSLRWFQPYYRSPHW